LKELQKSCGRSTESTCSRKRSAIGASFLAFALPFRRPLALALALGDLSLALGMW